MHKLHFLSHSESNMDVKVVSAPLIRPSVRITHGERRGSPTVDHYARLLWRFGATLPLIPFTLPLTGLFMHTHVCTSGSSCVSCRKGYTGVSSFRLLSSIMFGFFSVGPGNKSPNDWWLGTADLKHKPPKKLNIC